MAEMVERAARAMAEKNRGVDLWDEISHDSDIDYIGKDEFRGFARAVIEALREPTDEMIAAAMKPYVYGNDEAMNAALRTTIAGYWRAMIGEMLK